MQQHKEMKPKKFTYASQDGKVIVVDIEECNPGEDVFVPVSPEAKYHENGHFEAFLQYAYDQKLSIHIINTGYLKRFTRQLIEGAEEIDEKIEASACRIRDRWNTRNLLSSNKAGIVEEMKRNFLENREGPKLQYSTWEDWTIGKHEPRFKHFLGEIEKFYNDAEGEIFQVLMDGAVDDFYGNFHKSNETKEDYPDIYKAIGEVGVKAIIRQYIFEEAAVNLLWVDLGIKQKAYPFSQNTTCSKTVAALKNIIEKLFPEKDEETTMKFINLIVKEDSPRGSKQEGQQQTLQKVAINSGKLEAARQAKRRAEERARQLEEEKKTAEEEKKAAEEERKRLELVAAQLEERAKLLEEEKILAEEMRRRLEDLARKQRQRTLISTKILRTVDEEQREQKLDADVADEFRQSAIFQIERAVEEMDPSNYRGAPQNGTHAQNTARYGMLASPPHRSPENKRHSEGELHQKQAGVVTPTSLAGSPTEESYVLDKASEVARLNQ